MNSSGGKILSKFSLGTIVLDRKSILLESRFSVEGENGLIDFGPESRGPFAPPLGSYFKLEDKGLSRLESEANLSPENGKSSGTFKGWSLTSASSWSLVKGFYSLALSLFLRRRSKGLGES